jgi:hypothetical protein
MGTVFIGFSSRSYLNNVDVTKTAASPRMQSSHSYSAFLSSHEERFMADPRFPIGRFHYEGPPSADQRRKLIAEIEQTPAAIRAAVQDLSPTQMDTPYRDAGWNVRQVVHHVPESHMNAYIRFKLALTEEEPTIKPYAEDRWAKLADVRSTPTEVSLALLENLHVRWVILLQGLSEPDWKRTFIHPENGVVSLEKNLALYAWHGKHHTAHITELRKRMPW